VLVEPQETKRRGSGWVVDRERRLVLTGAELVGERKTAAVRFPMPGSEPASGVVLARDERRNLALFELDRLPREAIAGALAETAPQPGDPLHAITHANRPHLDWLYLGAFLRQVGPVKVSRDEGEEPQGLLLQAQPSDGEEGAAILDNHGRVVGQHSGKGPPQQQIAFAVDANEIRSFLKQQQSRWDPRTDADWVARARIFREARATERALHNLDRALEVAPNSATACGERAGLLLRANQPDAALRDANRAVELAPDQAEGWCRRAEVLAIRGELREALADSDKALTLNRQSADVQCVRAGVLRRLGRYAEALAHADEAVWLDRKNAAGHRERGWVHLDRDEAVRAIEEFDQALRLDDEDALTYRLRGEAKWNRSDVKGAMADFEAALQRDRDDARAWLGRGRAGGNAQDFTEALRRDSHLAAAYLERGAARLLGPAPGMGLDDLAEAVRLQPRLRESALGRVRQVIRQVQPGDPIRAGRIALGAVARLVPTTDGRLWWNLPSRPERWVELLPPS
jgi:tetratricopeptide (TPR) repeat protein